MTDRPAPAALSDTTVPSTTPTTDLPTTTEDRMSTQPTTSTTVEAAAPTSAERLSGGEPYILAFGGQATPWRTTLDELVDIILGVRLHRLRGKRLRDHPRMMT